MPRLSEQRDRLLAIEGALPPPHAMPAGCRFQPRCVFASSACHHNDPVAVAIGPRHHVACLHAPLEQASHVIAPQEPA